MHAMPVMIVVLCLMAIAYRFYSAFLAAKVATLDDSRMTPAEQFNDGHNFHPTNKWVLFGHHFAAISGAGPLIGPVLAAQFGYLPGLIWIVVGVCLAGAVQDFLVLAASLRRGGKSLAQIAFSDIGRVAGTTCSIAILFIIIIALAGLGKVVVKALGGEEVSYGGSRIVFVQQETPKRDAEGTYHVPAGSQLTTGEGTFVMTFNDAFTLKAPEDLGFWIGYDKDHRPGDPNMYAALLPKGAVRLVPGSSWGTFTIFCTIPIALLVGFWMYKIRPGKVIEASIIGAVLTLAATFIGGMIPGSPLEPFFNLKDTTVIIAMAVYGFIASVLPVWVLLAPRDYLSSFLKIGTIALLVGGVIIANPKLEAPAINGIFLKGGPTVPGNLFPFLFITIMCGAISGFHSLVSSGTTPKMMKKESQARMVGYGAMLIEGLVGVVAMIAAATLPVGDYYGMNTDLAKVPLFQDRFAQIGANVDHLNMYEDRTKESLRGRTGGAVTLAVGMAHVFDGAAKQFSIASEEALQAMWKYWYHFAIMFEALFILTTIDAGTRIGKILLQEIGGKVIHPKFAQPDWWPGAIISTILIVLAWAYFITANSMDLIWPMFGVANQMLAVIALAVVSAYLVNCGKTRYLWVTVLPMLFVFTTTSAGAVAQFMGKLDTVRTQLGKTSGIDWTVLINSAITGSLTLLMELCGIIIVLSSAIKIWKVTNGFRQKPDRGFEPVLAGK